MPSMRGRHPAHRFHHGVGPDPEDSRPLGRTARAATDLAGSRAAHRLGRARAGALSTATSSSHRLTSCPRSISTASDRGRTRGHDKAPRPPDSERLRADARKTPLPGAMAADPVSRFPGRDRAGRRERAAHPSGDARGSAIDRTILSFSSGAIASIISGVWGLRVANKEMTAALTSATECFVSPSNPGNSSSPHDSKGIW